MFNNGKGNGTYGPRNIDHLKAPIWNPPEPKAAPAPEVDLGPLKAELKAAKQEVQDLKDHLARMERNYEDILFNLDFDNMETHTRKPIESTISEVYPNGLKADSSIVQSAKEIRTEVRQVYAIKTYSGSGNPGSRDHNYIWKNTSTNTYYVYSDLRGQWIETETSELKTAFIQTADGFEFDADLVKISGDLIVGGTITGVSLETDEDAIIGKNLSLGFNGSAFTDGYINFGGPHSAAKISGIDDSIILSAMNGVFIGGRESSDNQVATQADIKDLWKAIENLQRNV